MYPIVVPGTENGERHVRCYCNLPSCVSTGYMCKSPRGGCYSALVQDVRLARHGCVDEDPEVDLTSKCMNSPGRLTGAWGSSLLLCCFSDLCNHVDNPLARVRINDSLSGANSLNALSTGGGAPNTDEAPETTGELWFRVATIAVPIFGALILFFLISVAIRMLRTDTQDASHKLSTAYVHQSSTQGPLEQPLMKKSPIQRTASPGHLPPVHLPLLVKNEENAKLNMAASSGSEDTYIVIPHPHIPHSSPVHKPTNKEQTNININTAHSQADSDSSSCNTKLYEKQRLPPDDKLYNKETIRYWGQTGSNSHHCPR